MRQPSNKDYLLIAIAILIAAVLRFTNYAGWSLTNDELSALNRIRFDGLWEVIKHGVMLNDTHPAGVQSFIYLWTSIFGTSEFSVRLPFVLAGIDSILLTYLIFTQWFGKQKSMLTTITMAILAYPILYSQLARPYSFGLFFSLSTVYLWTVVLFAENKANRWSYIGLGASIFFAMITHYFSFIFVAMVGITGLLFMKKHNYKSYLITCICAILLFVPHLKITLHQVLDGMHNVSWVAKPDGDWIWEYLHYAFNGSIILEVTIALIATIGIWLIRTKAQFNKFQLICFIWFIVPFLFGYLFSILKSPILQYSVLLFSFPFFIALVFSFIPKLNSLLFYICFSLIALIGMYSTIFEMDYYSNKKFAEFEDIANHISKWNATYGEENITRAVNVIDPYYLGYYQDKINDHSAFAGWSFREKDNLAILDSIVKFSSTPYFAYGWSNVTNYHEVEEIILSKYNKPVDIKPFFNSSVKLFTIDPEYKRPVLYKSILDFSSSNSDWNYEHTDSSTNYLTLKNDIEWSSVKFNKTLNDINPEQKDIMINISFESMSEKAQKETAVVMEIKREGEQLHWNAINPKHFYNNSNSWSAAIGSYVAQSNSATWNLLPNDEIVIYVWNIDKQEVRINNIKLEIVEYHPENYGYVY